MTLVTAENVSWYLNDFGPERFLELLHVAFSDMEGRIDPPSSLHKLTEEEINDFAADEILIGIEDEEDGLVACLFASVKGDHFYLSKWAVHPDFQRMGCATALLEWVEETAASYAVKKLVLETRIEIVENHITFETLGFVKTAETTHDGFDKPTGIWMEKNL
jgi:ribosomal protein S18 acetylase RimI-like enzyme